VFSFLGRTLGFSCVLLACASSAHAAPTDEADTLFEEGRKLMERGQLAEACPKLERSFQLAPRLGTMINLGACFERRGQLARAIAIYERAATLARQLGRADREAAAREYAAALEPRVAKLLVVTNEPSPELVTQVDGETISTRAGLIPLDPGTRKLVARSPGKEPFQTELSLSAGKTMTVTIPKLAPEKKQEKLDSSGRHEPVTVEASSGARTALLVTGFALGAAGIGAGTFFGLRAKSLRDEAAPDCPNACTTPEAKSKNDDARAAGNISTVAFIAGGVILAGTVVALIVTGKSSSPPSAALRGGFLSGSF
jgi:hypothetical protein